jgi:hypothetical protein
MSTNTCDPTCVQDPAFFHVARPVTQGDSYGIISFSYSDCSHIARSGQYLYGCPGDTSPAPVPELVGTVGVYGSLPASVRFDTPQPVVVDGGGPVLEAISSSSEVGMASGHFALSSWNASSGLAGFAGPGLLGVAAAALVVVLATRFVCRVRIAV